MPPSANQLYSATYSNVAVYEFLVNGGSVMRRKSDDWVNATHILKAANFAKAKRTRILEKEVQTSRHEKVQGGYGKYQGTWIPMADAQVLAKRFNVDQLLAPILDHIQMEGVEEPPLVPKHQHAKTKANKSRSVTGSPSIASRSATFPTTGTLKRTKSSMSTTDLPPKKRGRPKRTDSSVLDTMNSAIANSLIEAGNGEGIDLLKTFNDDENTPRIELGKNGLPKKKRGRKPKSKSVIEETFHELNGSSFQTPMKSMNSKFLRSFVNEKSSPLNENDLNSYFNSHLEPLNDHNHINSNAPSSSDLEDNENINLYQNRNAQLRHMLHSDLPSSPGDFMNDSDLARVLKSPENLNGLGIKNGRINENGKSLSYHSFINNGNNYHDNKQQNGFFTNSNNNENNNEEISKIKRKEEPTSWFDELDEFTQKLITYFMKPDDDEEMNVDQYHTSSSTSQLPDFLQHLPKSFNINKPIDPEGNTPLHWACAMGNLPVIELLLKNGADHRVKNKKDETPIMRTVRFNNSYQKRTFSKILDTLRDTLLETDPKGRTVLHHIGIGSGSAQKANSSRYYSEILLAKIRDIYPNNKVENYINLMDRKGNTGLFYAVSNKSKKLIKVLLSYGAKSDLKNHKGQSADELLIMNIRPSTPKIINNHQHNMKNLSKILSPKVDNSKILNDNTNGNTSKLDITSLPEVFLKPKYSQLIHSSTEKVGISLMNKLNKFSELYDEEFEKKQKLVYDLNKYYSDLNLENSTIEKNIIDSSSQDESAIIFAANKAELAKKIMLNNQEKVSTKINNQALLLQSKLEEFNRLLSKIQYYRIKSFIDNASNKDDPFIDDNKSKEKLELVLELTKCQVKKDLLQKSILKNFDDKENPEKSKKLNLYRRLVTACCNIGIDEVDGLIDIILGSLEK